DDARDCGRLRSAGIERREEDGLQAGRVNVQAEDRRAHGRLLDVRERIAWTAASASHCGSKFPLLARPRTMSASFRRAASIAFGRPLTVGASRPQASSKAFPSAFS